MANVQCVVLGSCAKSIQGHFQNFRAFGDSALDCELKLMLARAGKRVHITCIYQAKRKVILIFVNLCYNLHPVSANPTWRVTKDPWSMFLRKLS